MKTREIMVNISHDHLVQAVANYFYNSMLCPFEDNEVVLDIDIGITINEEGLVPVLIMLEEIEDEEE